MPMLADQDFSIDHHIKYIQEINKLKAQLELYNGGPLNKLTVNSEQEKQIYKNIKMVSKWEPSEEHEIQQYKEDYGKHLFITLTFDPKRFGDCNEPEEEQLYLLHLINQAYEKELLLPTIYGCFEKHKNGSIHAHFIGTVRYANEHVMNLKKFFKARLTDNPYNRNAVDIGNYRFKKSIEYINKEQDYKKWFIIKTFSRPPINYNQLPNTIDDLDYIPTNGIILEQLYDNKKPVYSNA